MSEDSKLRKIRGLLAMAEGTDNVHEAEAFMAQATVLIEKYGIDTAMLEADAISGGRLHPISSTIIIDNPYAKAKSMIVAAVGKFTNCKVVIIQSHGHSKTMTISIVGFEADVKMTEIMVTSLLAQCATAMRQATPVGNTKSFRHSFVIGFASRIGERLKEQKRITESEMHSSSDSTSTELVLIDRSKAVDEAFRQKYPRVQSRSIRSSSNSGRYLGDAAGSRASLGNKGVGGNRGALR